MKYRHLISDQRSNIALLLRDGVSISEIARKLHVNKSTISREVKRNSKIKESDLYDNKCKILKDNLLVCNNCSKRQYCTKTKIYYESYYADHQAYERTHSANQGPRIDQKTFAEIDKELYNLVVIQGLSIEVSRECSDILKKVCSKTLRNWVYSGIMKTKPINLKTKKKLKPETKYDYSRRKKGMNYSKKPFRTMSDYKEYINEHPNSIIIQTDSVEGKRSDEKAILTVFLKDEKLQIGYLYEREEASKNVYDFLLKFTKKILEKVPENKSIVFVTDNGVEFASMSDLEDINPRVRVYYAKPYCSTDKADCERNHEIFRYLYPKNHSMDNLTQNVVDNIFSNVNSYLRESLQWKSPCTKTTEAYGDDFLTFFNISKIEPGKVNVRPMF